MRLQGSNDIVGGTVAPARNVISAANGVGVQFDGVGVQSNLIVGNYIGTDITGRSLDPNRYGVAILNGATGNTVGGTAAGAGNLISGNTFDGIGISSSVANTTSNNLVAGNRIGTNASGTPALPNGSTGSTSRAVRRQPDRRAVPLRSQRHLGQHRWGCRRQRLGELPETASRATTSDPRIRRCGTPQPRGRHPHRRRRERHVIGTNGDGVNDATKGNVISGNGTAGNYAGVFITGTGTDSNVVAGGTSSGPTPPAAPRSPTTSTGSTSAGGPRTTASARTVTASPTASNATSSPGTPRPASPSGTAAPTTISSPGMTSVRISSRPARPR